MQSSDSYQAVVRQTLAVVKQLSDCHFFIRCAAYGAERLFSLVFKDFDGFNFILRTGLTDAIQLSIEIPKKIKCQFFPDMKIHAGIESVKKIKKRN